MIVEMDSRRATETGVAMQIKLKLSPEANGPVVKQLAIYSYAAKVRHARARHPETPQPHHP